MIRKFWFLVILLLSSLSICASGEDSTEGFILLADRGVLRGCVKEQPGQITILQGRSEIRLGRGRVACWAPTLAGLHQYLIDHRGQSSIASHLELARWCLRNEYPAGAEAEISAIYRKQPDHDGAQRLEAELRELTARLSQPPKPSRSIGSTIDQAQHDSEVVQETKTQNPPNQNGDRNELERQLAGFTRDIQPILLNTCSQSACHGNSQRLGFAMQTASRSIDRPDAETTMANLRSAMRWIDADNPSVSPLLVRALEPHGGLSMAPLGPGQRIAIDELRNWILLLNRNSGSARHNEQVAVHQAADSKPKPEPARLGPRRVPAIEDPFDPEVFNRRFHPDRSD